MKIKMLTQASGPDINAKPGDVLEVGQDVSKETAITLLNGGYAEKIAETAAPVETATAPEPEAPQTVQPVAKAAPKKGGKGK
jgi:ribosomal protein L6P/L9E